MIVFDMDGTLCDNSWRREYCPENAVNADDWIPYHLWGAEDEPIAGAVRLLQLLQQAGHEVVIVTARTDESTVRSLTWEWCRNQGLEVDEIYFMPPPETSVMEWKSRVVEKLAPDLVVDDCPINCAAFELLGIPTLRVPGVK